MKMFGMAAVYLVGAVMLSGGVRPSPASGSHTLVIYSGRHSPFSLQDSLELLKLQLQHVDTRVETTPMEAATSNLVATADHLVVLCPQPEPTIAPGLIAAVISRLKATLWVGFGMEQLHTHFGQQFEVSSRPGDTPLAAVRYRAYHWDAPVYPWMPATVYGRQAALLMTGFSLQPTNQYPLCWRLTNFTFLAALPTSERMNFLFTDLLFDFYGVKDPPPPRVFLRIEDYSVASNHGELQRKADYLYSRGLPFMIGVVPARRDAPAARASDLKASAEFRTALRYAQARGGRLVLRGLADPGEAQEPLWDPEQDRLRASHAVSAAQESVREFLEESLFPLAWQTPEYTASRETYRVLAGVFSTAVERVQLSDSTQQETAAPLGLTVDSYGRLIVAENLGYVRAPESTNALEEIRRRLELLVQLRGAVAGCQIHAFQPLSRLVALVQLLEDARAPFLDLADLPNAAAAPRLVLLSSGATWPVDWRGEAMHVRVYGRDGRLLEEGQQPSVERLRHNAGPHYQVFRPLAPGQNLKP